MRRLRDSAGVAAFVHSQEFAQAARTEADALRLEAERLREEAVKHIELAEKATAQAMELEHRLRELDELLGRAPQLRLDLQTDALRGQRLREVAVELVARQRRIGEPIHYREWFELLLAEGHTVEGKDPLATFLTQVTRSPVVLRESEQSGVYRVDPEAGGEEALRGVEYARRALISIREQLAVALERADDRAIEDLTQQLAAAERRAGAAHRALSEVARVQAGLRALAA
ncbi:MAG: hypothetical protein ABR583_04405 [Gaiellaceae bacterium]